MKRRMSKRRPPSWRQRMDDFALEDLPSVSELMETMSDDELRAFLWEQHPHLANLTITDNHIRALLVQMYRWHLGQSRGLVK